MNATDRLIAEMRQMVAAGERAELDYAPREHRVMREAAATLEALQTDSFTGQYEHGRWQGRAEELEARLAGMGKGIRAALDLLSPPWDGDAAQAAYFNLSHLLDES